MNIEFIFIHRVVELPDRKGELCRKEQEQHDVGNVHLPGPHHQPLGGGEKMATAYNGTVDEPGEIAGNEHEELGSIAEAVIAQGQPGNDVVRNVIEENHPQPHAAEQIEPEVALDGMRKSCSIVIGHRALSILSCWVSCLVGYRAKGREATSEELRKAPAPPSNQCVHGSQSMALTKPSARITSFVRLTNAY